MKRRNRFFLVYLSIGLVLALLVFQTAMAAGQSNDSGLVPDRASTGDPPLIPHDVEASDNSDDCLACHKDGDDDTPKMPDWHATLTDCRQCHIPYVESGAVFKPEY